MVWSVDSVLPSGCEATQDGHIRSIVHQSGPWNIGAYVCKLACMASLSVGGADLVR